MDHDGSDDPLTHSKRKQPLVGVRIHPEDKHNKTSQSLSGRVTRTGEEVS